MKTAIRSFGLVIVLCVIAVGECAGQETVKVRERINTIISESIKRCEFTTADGLKAITRVPPSAEHMEEIKGYGDQAVQPLEQHLWSENALEYEFAMRFMGGLGGERIIAPLETIALYNQSARKREYALRWITQGSWELARKVISQAAENDRDQGVRNVAKELLAGRP